MILHNRQPENHWYTETFIFPVGWSPGTLQHRLWFVGLVSRLWVELRLAPHVSFLRHSFTVVTGTQEELKHRKPLRPPLKGHIAISAHRSIGQIQIAWPSPNIQWDGKILYPFWALLHGHLKGREWRLRTFILSGPHRLCLGHMAPIHRAGMPWKGIPGSTSSESPGW